MQKLQNLDLLQILEKFTSSKGYYMLHCNVHKSCYCDVKDSIIDYYFPGHCEDSEEETKRIQEEHNVSFEPDYNVYCLDWYNISPVGNYTLYANSMEDLKQYVIELIQDNKQEFMLGKEFNEKDMDEIIYSKTNLR